MQNQTEETVAQAIQYIEMNLENKLSLDQVADALHYSKFHLHRLFKKTTGLTIHDYIQRRQLTKAAQLLVSSQKSILEIAFISGYESQQAFTGIFKALYKITPSEYRIAKDYYPLQLEMHIKEESTTIQFTTDQIQFACPNDITAWMLLVNLTIDGYPHLNKANYIKKLYHYILNQKALILKDKDTLIGALGFSTYKEMITIDFLAIHPQYRRVELTKLFLNKLMRMSLYKKEISITTYRLGDKADIGYRKLYHYLGFIERELLIEYGYPTQRFSLIPKNKEEFL